MNHVYTIRRFIFTGIVLITCNRCHGAAVGGRSVSALKEICERFPWINNCRTSDMAPATATVPAASTISISPTNQDLQYRQPSDEDYCKKYSSNFNSYCEGRSTDGVITKFCQTYQKNCLLHDESVQTHTTVQAINQVLPTFAEIKHYCGLNKEAYLNLCVNRKINEDAKFFCSGYNNICPGSPDPGIVRHASSQTRRKPSRTNVSQKNPYISSEQTSDQEDSFPLDGNIGSMLGILSGGGGPLGGLGGMNNMHLPNFGGPVDGGLGLGRSVYAPFFGGNKGFNVVPTKSFMQGENYNFAGMSAGGMSGVDWSGTPGLNVVNRALGLSENGHSNSGGGLPGFGRKRK